MRPSNSKTISRVLGAATLAVLGLASGAALADRIKHPTGVFAGLDKITGRIIAFEVAIDETVQFGSLQITPRICYTRPQTEAPQTTGFVEIDELQEDRKFRRIFSGWMFAASPGLHGVEHPVYDVWLTDCKGGTEVIRTQADVTEQTEPPPNADVRKPGGPTQQKPREPRRRVDPNAQGAAPAPLQPAPPPPQIEVPRRAPSQRFFPLDNGLAGPPDPAGR